MKKDVFRYSDCPMHRSMAIIGTKWKPIIVYGIGDKITRFGQLRAAIGTISKKVLSNSLKELEGDGVVIRTEYDELVPRVEYRLTERGKELIPIMNQLAEWG